MSDGKPLRVTDSAQTIQGPGPGPVREGALARLVALIGQHEQGGKNWGPIVWKVAGPFLSPARLESYAPGGSRAGRLQWCALAVCWAILAELEARGHNEVASQWKRMASASCETLHGNLDSMGFAWDPGRPLPAALCPQGMSVAGTPGPGDIVFYGRISEDGTLDFRHVDLYERATPGGFDSVGGNSGPKADGVARAERLDGEARVIRLARLPW